MPKAIHSTRVIIPSGVIEATLILADGKIRDVLPGRVEREGVPFESFGDKVIMPGVIDAHVHINEPGRTEWEGFETATKAAAAGGITTMIEMPLNADPVTITAEALRIKFEAAKNKLHVNVGFYGGLVPDNLPDLPGLLKSGVFGIKAFLTHSGIDEFPNITEADLRKALPMLMKYGSKLLVHCELEGALDWSLRFRVQDRRSYSEYLGSRPAQWETDAIALMIRLSEEFDVHVHIVHVSAAEALPLIRDAKKRGLREPGGDCKGNSERNQRHVTIETLVAPNLNDNHDHGGQTRERARPFERRLGATVPSERERSGHGVDQPEEREPHDAGERPDPEHAVVGDEPEVLEEVAEVDGRVLRRVLVLVTEARREHAAGALLQRVDEVLVLDVARDARVVLLIEDRHDELRGLRDR